MKNLIFKNYTIELKANVLGLWELFINGVDQNELFFYDFEAFSWAKNLIDNNKVKTK